MTDFTLNGKAVSSGRSGDTPLLWVLRDELKQFGTKYGCGIGQCGACTVHLDGRAVRSCSLPVAAVEGRAVQTIEAAEADPVGRAVQAAWQELEVVQCGYCQSGQIMSAVALLQDNPAPSDADIDTAMGGNLCRCATYHRIRKAIHLAAEALA